MGHIYTQEDADAYSSWASVSKNKRILCLETGLMLEMLRPVPGESVLDVGCGSGTSMVPFMGKGIQQTGIDPSHHMLDMAEKRVGRCADFHLAVAEDLPFEDNSFNHGVLFNSLEFVDDPEAALSELFRVAKDTVFIGALNRYAIKGLQRRLRGIFSSSIYNKARFFSIWEVKQIVRTLAGDVPVTWRSVGQFPEPSDGWGIRLEENGWMKRFPFGTFVGMVIVLNPRYRTKPLGLKVGLPENAGAVTGPACIRGDE